MGDDNFMIDDDCIHEKDGDCSDNNCMVTIVATAVILER